MAAKNKIKTPPKEKLSYRRGEKYKATKQEVLQRLDEIENFIREGVPAQAEKYFQNKYQLSRNQVQKYLHKVRVRIKRRKEKEFSYEKSMALVELDHLQAKGVKAKNLEFILAVRKEKNKILGLYAPEKVNLSLDSELSELERIRKEQLGQ